MPFFSVVIPLYNKEKFVENAIKSIINQGFTDYEVIIINDCSTDESKTIASRFVSEKIQLIEHNENKGLSASRNTGIKIAKAQYITFLDADDEWKPNYLSKIYSLITTFPEAKLFATNYEELYQNNVKIISKSKYIPDGDVIIDDFFGSNLGKPIYCSCSLCVEKSVFETIGFYNEKITYGEDVDFNIRANSKFKLAYSQEALVTYTQISENQITNSFLYNKTIPDFNSFEVVAKENRQLKKYLDFNRYVFAKNYKLENNVEKFREIKLQIDFNNLNYKQVILLYCPNFVLKMIRVVKKYFISKGKLFSTYD